MPPRPLPGRHGVLAAGAARAARLADRLDARARAGRFTREVSLTLAAVLLVGVGAAGATPTEAAAPAVSPVAAVTPAVVAPAGPRLPAPAADGTEQGRSVSGLPLPPATAPRPAVPARPAPPAAAPERWLPRGTGMWLHDWSRTESGQAAEVVRRSMNTGLTHLYVQTGSTKKGWIGDEVLSELLPATEGTGLKVIAWDFPKLIDPEADARRMARAALWSRPGVPRVAAVAPDVETASEGTRLSTPNVLRYYRELRKQLPADIAILATVPWPSEKRTGWYPYDDTAPFADAFVPMAYWYNRSPSQVTATSMTWLGRFGKPVMPVGQGYDGRIDAPYLAADTDPGKSVATFIAQAHRQGAQSVSLWSWQTTQAPQWQSLLRAAGTVGGRSPAALPGAAALPTPSAAPSRTPADAAQAREEKARAKAPGRKQQRRPGRG